MLSCSCLFKIKIHVYFNFKYYVEVLYEDFCLWMQQGQKLRPHLHLRGQKKSDSYWRHEAGGIPQLDTVLVISMSHDTTKRVFGSIIRPGQT